MERTRVNLTGMRTKLANMGKTQRDWAQAAQLPESALSAMLNGKEYLGAKRATRLMDALHQLALEVEAQKQAEAAAAAAATGEASTPSESPEESPEENSARKSEPKPQATIRIRRL